MKQADKIRVAVLFGGCSAEHEVSLRSAENVIRYLDPAHFQAIPVGIDKLGNWFMGDEVFAKSIKQQTVPKLHDEHPTWFTPEWVGKAVSKNAQTDVAPGVLGKAYFDVVFPAVHGTNCEDGTLQGLLELADMPYVGCGVLASAVGMDKDIAKRLVKAAGVPVAPYCVVNHARWLNRPADVIADIETQLHYPLFVKPANAGSSIGITKVKQASDLAAALDEAFRFDTKILIEQGLDVLELEVAVLESLEADADPIISVVGEIKPNHEFYSYDAKYLDQQGADLLIPASVNATVHKEAQQLAKTIFTALACEGMARIDLFFDKATQQLYFNEINTLPGFTQISMYPKLMDASGKSYPDLLTHLVQLAIKRHRTKGQLIRSYSG